MSTSSLSRRCIGAPGNGIERGWWPAKWGDDRRSLVGEYGSFSLGRVWLEVRAPPIRRSPRPARSETRRYASWASPVWRSLPALQFYVVHRGGTCSSLSDGSPKSPWARWVPCTVLPEALGHMRGGGNKGGAQNSGRSGKCPGNK